MPYLGKQPANVPVTADDIPDNSITSAKILDGVITIADIGANAVGNSEMADDAVGVAELSATGTASNTTFLRGDNSWQTAGSTSASDLTSGTLPDARFPSTLPAISGANLTGITGTTTRAHAFSKNATGGLVWTHSESSLILKDGNNNDNYLDVVIGSSDQVYSINSDGQFILTYTQETQMSTVNLGQIKPVFKGAYNNSTAYVLDNIVTSAGSSYICILASTGNAVSNATYWTQMSAAGTNGTDGTDA